MDASATASKPEKQNSVVFSAIAMLFGGDSEGIMPVGYFKSGANGRRELRVPSILARGLLTFTLMASLAVFAVFYVTSSDESISQSTVESAAIPGQTCVQLGRGSTPGYDSLAARNAQAGDYATTLDREYKSLEPVQPPRTAVGIEMRADDNNACFGTGFLGHAMLYSTGQVYPDGEEQCIADLTAGGEGAPPPAFSKPKTREELEASITYSSMTVEDCAQFRLEPGDGKATYWTQLPMVPVDRLFRPKKSSTPSELDGLIMKWKACGGADALARKGIPLGNYVTTGYDYEYSFQTGFRDAGASVFERAGLLKWPTGRMGNGEMWRMGVHPIIEADALYPFTSIPSQVMDMIKAGKTVAGKSINGQGAYFIWFNEGGGVVWGRSEIVGEISAATQDIIDNRTVAGVESTDKAFFVWFTAESGGGGVAWGDSNNGGEIPAETQDIIDNRTVAGVESNYGAFFVWFTTDSGGGAVAWGNSDDGGEIPRETQDIIDNRTIAGAESTSGTSSTFFVWFTADSGGGGVAWSSSYATNPEIPPEIQDIIYNRTVAGAEYNGYAFFVWFTADSGGGAVAWGDSNYGGEIPAETQDIIDNRTVAGVESNYGAFFVWFTTDSGGGGVAWGNSDDGGEIPAETQDIIDNRTVAGVESNYGAFFVWFTTDSGGGAVAWGSIDYGGEIPKDIQQKLENTEVIEAALGYYTCFVRLASGALLLWTWLDSSKLEGGNAIKLEIDLAQFSALSKIDVLSLQVSSIVLSDFTALSFDLVSPSPIPFEVKACKSNLKLNERCAPPQDLRSLEGKDCCDKGLMCNGGVCVLVPASGVAHTLHMCSMDSSRSSQVNGVDDPDAWHFTTAFNAGSSYPSCPAFPADADQSTCQAQGGEDGRSLADINTNPLLGGPYVTLTEFGGGLVNAGTSGTSTACNSAPSVPDDALGLEQCIAGLDRWLSSDYGKSALKAGIESAGLCEPWAANPPYLCTEEIPKFSSLDIIALAISWAQLVFSGLTVLIVVILATGIGSKASGDVESASKGKTSFENPMFSPGHHSDLGEEVNEVKVQMKAHTFEIEALKQSNESLKQSNEAFKASIVALLGNKIDITSLVSADEPTNAENYAQTSIDSPKLSLEKQNSDEYLNVDVSEGDLNI